MAGIAIDDDTVDDAQSGSLFHGLVLLRQFFCRRRAFRPKMP
jgi:hypothetical protein